MSHATHCETSKASRCRCRTTPSGAGCYGRSHGIAAGRDDPPPIPQETNAGVYVHPAFRTHPADGAGADR